MNGWMNPFSELIKYRSFMHKIVGTEQNSRRMKTEMELLRGWKR